MADAAVEIQRIQSSTIVVPIVGTAPLLVHRFSEKAKKQMLDNQQGRKSPKQAKDPVAEFEAASYRLGDGYGFPAAGFKAALISGARYYSTSSISMTALRQFVFVHGEMGPDGIQLARLEGAEDAEGDWPAMREDVVRVKRGGTDLRYRPAFWPWRVSLRLTYVVSALTQESVLALLDAGGMGRGIGEWRPEKNGDFGTFQIDDSREIQVVKGGSK